MIRRLRSLWCRLRVRSWLTTESSIRDARRAMERAQLDLALRQGTDPASLSIRVGGREDESLRPPSDTE
jgi:hypothetical protein